MHYFMFGAMLVILVVTSHGSEVDEELCLTEEESNEYMLHKSVESLQKWMSSEVTMKVKKLSATVEHLTQVISKYEAKESSLSLLQSTVSSLQAELSEYKLFVKEQTSFKATVQQELNTQNLIIKQQAIALQNFKHNITSCGSECITDIKVSDVESSQLMKGPGYKDSGEQGYLLTGIYNFNKDAYAETAYRRKMLFKKKNEWIPLHP